MDGCPALSVKTLGGRQKVKALAHDKGNDLAVVGPAKPASPPLAFSGNQRLKLGQSIITVGYPLQRTPGIVHESHDKHSQRRRWHPG